MTTRNGIIYNLPDRDYFDGPEVSSHQLKLALESPARYCYEVLEGRGGADTPTLAFGRTVHAAVLEPERFDADIVVADCNTRAAKAYKTAAAENPDRTVITAGEYESAAQIAGAVLAHRRAAELLAGADTEVSVFWDESGRKARARPDIWQRHGHGYIADLKTTANAAPSSFIRDIFKYQYHLSAAWYLRGIEMIGERVPREWYWIAVEKSPPYLVQVYEADEATLMIGESQWRKALATLDRCEARREWPAFDAPEIFRVVPPDWAGIDL